MSLWKRLCRSFCHTVCDMSIRRSVTAIIAFLCLTRCFFDQGQKCSRCSDHPLKSSDCTGCEIARIGSVSLTYSDAIAVEFDSDNFETGSEVPADVAVVDHKSMDRKRAIEQLKLEDCIHEFHQSEVLDDENPWHCPSCQSHQRAHKSLSIWRSPPVLMVYLKRFIFHDMMPIKIEDSVSYPMRLDLSDPMRKGSNDWLYDLEGIVCHCGGSFSPNFRSPDLTYNFLCIGVSAGHYTAFTKHCISGQWLHYNDSSVTAQDPSLSDERAYVLFYRKSGISLHPLNLNVHLTERGFFR